MSGSTPPEADRPGSDVDSDYAFEAVPLTARRGFWAVGFVMLGFTFFSASMTVGANLGNGLDLPGFVWAVTIGGAILAVYTAFLAYIGARTGLGMSKSQKSLHKKNATSRGKKAKMPQKATEEHNNTHSKIKALKQQQQQQQQQRNVTE